MKSLLQKTLLFVVLFTSSLSVSAQTDAEVCQWVKQIILDTLSIDYNYKTRDRTEFRKNYSDNAWSALVAFLGGYVKVVKEQRLTLHPKFAKEPFIENQWVANGVQYWRVDSVVLVSELNEMVAFSMVVTKPFDRFVIQSVDMLKKDNP
ncbi:Macrophage killing protein with similarity to conjugation protein [Legionella gratiana]|uniref:Macrophage killing protein with similarity to conjugation protein n=1 Tax=Legionella gratiana TaxID=45066 RepID=A0A378JGN2_9GAMM|nr:DotI/IcmL/TraM family protein [Legionella gratiana]KTD15141.1 Macrophage killing protein with similarity to conjugation protein [Legionella gratiana]STX46098.1 Macrophage killing protein with similarity to conjugation protein [Legionella gratiana]